MAKKHTPQGTGKVQLVAWPTVIYFVGLFDVFLAERMASSEQVQRVLDLLGVAVMVGMIVTLLGRRSASIKPVPNSSSRSADNIVRQSDERKAYSWLVGGAAVSLLGVLIYFLFNAKAPAIAEPLRGLFGKHWDSAKDLSSVLWPALVLLGILPMAFIQRALGSMTDGEGYAETVEIARVRYSAQSGLTIALVVIFCAGLNYIASERNHKWDLAKFRSTRPSETTIKIIQNLSKPIKATLFFPTPNEVRELVVPYFEELAKENPRFTFDIYDHALEPNRAKDLSASGNGTVVLSVSEEVPPAKPGQPPPAPKVLQREVMNTGMSLELAQNALSTFDGDVQKKLLTLSRPGRIVYFTTGHGERGFDTAGFSAQKEDAKPPVGFLRTLLQNQAYEVKTVGVGQGLSNKVPDDAGLVIVAGATEHFLPEEVAALRTYLEGGGHIYLLLDPAGETANADLAPLLKLIGVKYSPELLAHDEIFFPLAHKVSDKVNIVSISFSSHVSVTTLSRHSGRAGIVLPHTGSFSPDGGPPAGIQVNFPLRSMPKTYQDTNNNFTMDNGEKSQVFELSVVAQKTIVEPGQTQVAGKGKKEMRLGVLGSVDAVADLFIQIPANRVLATDTTKWLMQDEALVGESVQETDQPIVHTKDQDKLWFYSTIIAAPLAVLAIGFLYIRRVRRRRSS